MKNAMQIFKALTGLISLLILFFVIGSTIIFVVLLISGYMDNGFKKSWMNEEPKRIEKCFTRGIVFERKTKYDRTYGCLEFINGEWQRVKE
jgi:hypothetical protein